MQKFSEIPYTRPDIAALADAIRSYTAAIPKAGSLEEARTLLLEHNRTMSEYYTMYTIASVRNTVDTRDAFYETEIEFLDSEDPKLNLLIREANEVLLASPYRKELEKEGISV